MAKEHELLFRINAQMGSSYQATFREATAAMGSLREEYNALANTAKDIAAYQRQAQAVENTKAKLELLQQQYANIQREISETGGFSSDLENKLASKQHQIDKTTEALQNQTEKLDQYEAALQQAGVDTSNLEGESKRLADEMDELRKKEQDAGDSADEFGKNTADALKDLEDALVSIGVIKLVEELTDQIKECVSASMEFEVGMAAVRRTVGGSEEEISALGDEFQRMAAVMPITTSELTEIATTAGQLGIAQENVVGFTRVMAELGTTTDLSADKAATLLAQFSNITGTTDYDRLGSTVAALGDSTATTASRIVEMSQGMAAAATVAGMTAQDIIGISAAVGALGGRVQTGATAMSQLITKLYLAIETGEGLEDYAQAAGMSAQEFKRAWGEDAAGALNTFIQGLNDTERNGKSAIAVLNDLGITNARQLRVFTGLAQGGDLLTRTIDMANQSWSENTALQEKAGIMYDTTKAKMTTMQNEFNNLRIAIGDQFNPALGRLYEMMNNAASTMTKFAEEHPEITRALTSMALGLAIVTAGLAAYTAAAIAAKVASDSLAGPIGWLDLAITALIAGLGIFVATSEEAEDVLRDTQTAISDMEQAATSANASLAASERETNAAAMTAKVYIDRLKELEAAGTATGRSQEEYRSIVDELNRLIPGLNAEIDEQTGLVKGGTSALEQNTEAWKQNAIMQAVVEANTEKIKAWAELQLKVNDATVEANRLDRERIRIENEIAEKESKISAAQNLRNELTRNGNLSTEELIARQEAYDAVIYQLNIDLENLRMQQEQNRSDLDAANLAVDEGTTAMNAYEGEIERSKNALSGFADSSQDAAEATESMLGPLDDVLGGIGALADAYNEAYEAAEKAILKQYSLWEEAPEIVGTGTDEIIAALDSQIGYWTSYSDNLDNLMSRNIDGLDAMVQAVADGSEDSAKYIAGLAGASDEEVEAIVGQFNSLREVQKNIGDDIAIVQSNFDKAMKGMVDSAKNAVGDMKLTYDARQAAIQTVNAYIDAADGMVGQVRAAYAAVAGAARDALQYGSMTVIPRTGGENIGRVGYGGAAGGIDNAPEGWRWVGELGPELMYFQGGETVIPHTKSVEMLQGGDRTQVINVTLAPSYQISGSGSTENIREILEEHDRQLPGKVTAILREAERDAVRRSYS